MVQHFTFEVPILSKLSARGPKRVHTELN
jgi:hypothetical protein